VGKGALERIEMDEGEDPIRRRVAREMRKSDLNLT